jgi:hypothetical protein
LAKPKLRSVDGAELLAFSELEELAGASELDELLDEVGGVLLRL